MSPLRPATLIATESPAARRRLMSMRASPSDRPRRVTRSSPAGRTGRSSRTIRAAGSKAETEAGAEQPDGRRGGPGLRRAGDRVGGRPLAAAPRESRRTAPAAAGAPAGLPRRPALPGSAPPRRRARSGRGRGRSARCRAAKRSRCGTTSGCSGLPSSPGSGCPSRSGSSRPATASPPPPRVRGARDAAEQRVAGVRGAHAAGPLGAVERQRVGAQLLAPEGLLEARAQRGGLASPAPRRAPAQASARAMRAPAR